MFFNTSAKINKKIVMLTKNKVLTYLKSVQVVDITEGCQTLRELRETQGIFKLKKISRNFYLFFKLRETQESFDCF